MIDKKKIIIKSFRGDSSLDIIRFLIKKGFSNTQDLSRISGAPLSNLLKVSKSFEKPGLTNLVGAKLGRDEIHFYELLSKSLSLGLIKKKVIFYGDEIFVKSLLSSYNGSFDKIEIQKGILTEVNLNPNKLEFNPNIGGLFAKSINVDLLSKLEDFSVKQLDLLYKGIAQNKPNYEFLKEIELILKRKIGG